MTIILFRKIIEGLKGNYPYTKSNRLADVLKLIQILALDSAGQRTEGKLLDLLGKPKSATNWESIGDAHGEFFHVSRGKGTEISLIVRRLQEPQQELPKDYTSRLMETAIKIYDSQLIHSRWWTFFMPVIGAFIGALIGRFLTI